MEKEQRPGRYEFTSDTPEYYRWYEYGGQPREKPLTLDEMEQFYRDKGYAPQEAKAAAWSSGARPSKNPAQEKTVAQDQDENFIEPTLTHEKVRTADEEVEKFLRRRNQRGVGFQLDSPDEKNRASAPGQQIETQNALPETYSKNPVVPERIKKQYLQIGNRFYFEKNPDQVAIEDKGNKLHTRSDGVNVASSMVEIAQARGWTEIRARGSEDFRRNVWLKAQARGVEVKGYEPKEVDLAALEKQLRQRGESKNSAQKQTAKTTQRAGVPALLKNLQAQAVREKKPEELVRDHPEMSNEAATLKLAEKIARRFPKEVDQRRFMEKVQNRVAAKVEHGQTSPQIKVKETREVQTVREERFQGR